jgi:hypothetical protein
VCCSDNLLRPLVRVLSKYNTLTHRQHLEAMAEGLAAEHNARLMDKALKQGVCALALSPAVLLPLSMIAFDGQPA